jgi:hypothetical protein
VCDNLDLLSSGVADRGPVALRRLNGVGAYITNAAAFLDSGTDVGAFYKVDVAASLDGPFNAVAANRADRSRQLAFTLKWS